MVAAGGLEAAAHGSAGRRLLGKGERDSASAEPGNPLGPFAEPAPTVVAPMAPVKAIHSVSQDPTVLPSSF
jgi:hypothetical protein